jgi:hypothetical protein
VKLRLMLSRMHWAMCSMSRSASSTVGRGADDREHQQVDAGLNDIVDARA